MVPSLRQETKRLPARSSARPEGINEARSHKWLHAVVAGDFVKRNGDRKLPALSGLNVT